MLSNQIQSVRRSSLEKTSAFPVSVTAFALAKGLKAKGALYPVTEAPEDRFHQNFADTERNTPLYRKQAQKQVIY